MSQGNDIAKKPRIAICGTRGVPACYGGFETLAEELGSRLVERGWQVTVYGRKHVIDYSAETYRGMQLRLLSAPRQKYLETPVHSLLSFIDLVRRREIDVVLLCNGANSPFVWIPRLFGIPVAINVDGIERKRAKWNWLGKLWYALGEICSVLFASKLIADADIIRDYYRSHYGRESEIICYGYRETAPALIEEKLSTGKMSIPEAEQSILREFGLEAGEYLLYVSRLEPENNAKVVIEAFRKLPLECQRRPLVIVGDAPYAKDYIDELHQLAEGANIRFTGFRFGAAYETLQRGAYLYIQATEVGGTHPALVEAMGYANAIVANDVPEHREVLGSTGWYYRKNDNADLADKLQTLIQNSAMVMQLRGAARKRAESEYSWQKVTEQYARLFDTLYC